MLTLEELREMASIDSDADYYVSLYLNVDPLANPRGEYLVEFKNMVKDAAEKTEKPAYKKIKKDLEAIEDYFIGSKREFRKGLCLISSRGGGYWKEFHLPVPVKSRLIVDKVPYLKPLIEIMDAYRRYIVLLLDKENARIFVTGMGELVEYTEMHAPDIPGRHKEGDSRRGESVRSTKGETILATAILGDKSQERHVAVHVGIHVNDVVGHMERIMEGQAVEGIVTGGPEEVLYMAIDRLPERFRELIIGTFAAGMYETGMDVLKKAMSVTEGHKHKRDAEKVDELMERTLKDQQAVLGMEDVLFMLEEQRIMELLVDSDFSQPGYFCRNCRALSAGAGTCPYCKGPFEKVNYMASLVMQKTVELGGRVSIVYGNEKLRNAGGIGAFLRY